MTDVELVTKVDRRSGLRRWCDPNTCGSRAKGRRNYLRGGKIGR